MPAGASGVVALAGTAATFGAPTGTDVGALTGVVAGDNTGAGGLAGDRIGADAFADGLGVGETDVVGDFAGVVAGDFAGGVDNGGEIVGVGDKAGDFEGDAGELTGDFEGDVGEVTGEMVGEVAGEFEGDVGVVTGEMVGEFETGEGDFVGFGEGEGALSACTTPECETNNTNKESTTRQCIIFVCKNLFVLLLLLCSNECGMGFREIEVYIREIVGG